MQFLLAQTNTESKAIIAENPNKSSASAIVEGGGIVVGGLVVSAGVWTVISKLLERFGNTAIDARQKELEQKLEQQKQDLVQQRELFEYFKSESAKDSSTLNEALRDSTQQVRDIAKIFVTKELDSSAQYKDLYYEFLKRMESMEEAFVPVISRQTATEALLKDILAVLKMKERQNG